MHPKDCKCIRCKVGRSSFGTPEATAARESVSDERVSRVVARAKELDAIGQVLADTGVTANTWQSAARRLGGENERLREALARAVEVCDRFDGYGHGVNCTHLEDQLPCSVCTLLGDIRAALRTGRGETRPIPPASGDES